jgi:hypothetical protein
VIAWYSLRWNIEQLFRTLKSQGLDVESSMLENGTALERLAMLGIVAATKIMQLVLARDPQQHLRCRSNGRSTNKRSLSSRHCSREPRGSPTSRV